MSRRADSHAERYLPTPQQVARMCRDIQSGWSRKDRIRRTVNKTGRWQPPVVREVDLGMGHDASGF